MDLGGALNILRALADGVDPSTGELAAKDSALQQPATVRALHFAIAALQRDNERPEKRNSYGAWSSEEDARLCEEFHCGVAFSEIANIHGRSRGAIVSRLEKLGKLKRQGNPWNAA